MRLNYEIEIPVLGYMFVPQMGASYYEMFELGAFVQCFSCKLVTQQTGKSQKTDFRFPFQTFYFSTWS